MKTIFTLCFLLCCLSLFGATPGFNDIPFTNTPAGVVSSKKAMSRMNITNLFNTGTATYQGPQVLLTKGITLTLGTNVIPAWSNSVFVVSSPTNNPSLVTLQLAPGTNTVQYPLLLINGGGAFTLYKDSTNKTGGGYTRLGNGNWVSQSAGDTIVLAFNSPDWTEAGRYGTNSGVGAWTDDGTFAYLNSHTNAIHIDSVNGGIISGTNSFGYWPTFSQDGGALLNYHKVQNGDPDLWEIFLGAESNPTNHATVDLYGYHDSARMILSVITNQVESNLDLQVADDTTNIVQIIGSDRAGTNHFKIRASSELTTIELVVGNNLVTSLTPTAADADASVPNALIGSSTTRTSGTNTLWKNGTNVIGSLLAVSGYTGAGTNFLSDDGTYKTAAAAQTNDTTKIAIASGVGTNNTFTTPTLVGDANGTNVLYFTASGSTHSNGVGQAFIGSGRISANTNTLAQAQLHVLGTTGIETTVFETPLTSTNVIREFGTAQSGRNLWAIRKSNNVDIVSISDFGIVLGSSLLTASAFGINYNSTGQFITRSDGEYGFSANTVTSGVGDTKITRVAAGIISLGTNAVARNTLVGTNGVYSVAQYNSTAGTAFNWTSNNLYAGKITVSGSPAFLTNSIVTANSVVLATINTDDATASTIKAIPTAGLIQFKFLVAPTGNTDISWMVASP